MNKNTSSTHRHNRRVEIIDITPAMANTWLAQNTHNRPLRANLVRNYATTMKRGEWKLTPEPIVFSAPFTDPDSMKKHPSTLMEGQHRLAAIAQSGVTIPATVWFNCDAEEFKVLGQGAARNAGDFLAINRSNIKEPYVVASIISAFMRRSLSLKTSCYPWMVQHVLHHLERPIVRLASYRKKLKKLWTRELTSAFLLAMLVDSERTCSLLDQMELGLGFKNGEPGGFLYRYMWSELTSIKRDTGETSFRRICNLLVAHLKKEKFEMMPKSGPDGLIYLRDQNRKKLDLILVDLLGMVPRDFYEPKMMGLKYRIKPDGPVGITPGEREVKV